MNIQQLSGEEKPKTAEKALDFVLAVGEQNHGDWWQTPSETGRINGRTFARARWSGTEREKGRKVHAFTYVSLDGGKIIWFNGNDAVPYSPEALKLAEAAVLTFRLPKSRNPIFKVTDRTRKVIRCIFPKHQAEVARLLTTPRSDDFHTSERWQLCVLRMSKGNLQKLREWAAWVDYRDVLGFSSPEADQAWAEQIIKAGRWVPGGRGISTPETLMK